MSFPTKVATRFTIEEDNSDESDEDDLEDVLHTADVLAGGDAELEGLPDGKNAKKTGRDCPKDRIVAICER